MSITTRCITSFSICACLSPAIANAEVNYDLGVLGNITFPSDQSFADVLVSTDIDGTDVWCSTNAPQCGCPPDSHSATEGGPLGPPLPYSSISLGDDGSVGGTIVVEFTDNVLVDQSGFEQSGGLDPDADLFVYEGGGQTEGVYVSISEDGSNWVEFGARQSWPIAIDIGSHPDVTPGQEFRFVRLEEIVDSSSFDGQCWSGADIVAVGAIGSIDSTCTESAKNWSESQDWPVEELTYWGWPHSAVSLWGLLNWNSPDASVILMQQLVAVDLNLAAGALPHAIEDARQEALDLLHVHNVGLDPQGDVRDELLELADELAAWNTGAFGPGAC